MRAQQTQQEGQQRRNFGGDPRVSVQRSHHVLADDQRGDGEEYGQRQPVEPQGLAEVAGDGAGQGDQREGAHPGAALLALAALALEADQHAEPECDGETQREIRIVHQYPGLPTNRAWHVSRRPASARDCLTVRSERRCQASAASFNTSAAH